MPHELRLVVLCVRVCVVSFYVVGMAYWCKFVDPVHSPCTCWFPNFLWETLIWDCYIVKAGSNSFTKKRLFPTALLLNPDNPDRAKVSTVHAVWCGGSYGLGWVVRACWSWSGRYHPVGTSRDTVHHWSRRSVARCHALICSRVSFKFNFNRLNLKTNRFYCYN
jgi:hypothetical protein